MIALVLALACLWLWKQARASDREAAVLARAAKLQLALNKDLRRQLNQAEAQLERRAG